MHKLKKSLLLFCFCLMASSGFAQQISKEDTSDFMRSSGKIFVVMAVALVIMIALFIYLINLDRKINKLEKGEKTGP